MKLCDVADGEHFCVKYVTLAGEIGKRVAEMGFNQGTRGRVIRRALLGDPIEVCVLGYHVSLRKAEAEGIEVETVQKPARREQHCRGCTKKERRSGWL